MAVPSRYHDRTNTSWGTDLGKVGDKAKGKRSDVQKALTAALANIPA